MKISLKVLATALLVAAASYLPASAGSVLPTVTNIPRLELCPYWQQGGKPPKPPKWWANFDSMMDARSPVWSNITPNACVLLNPK